MSDKQDAITPERLAELKRLAEAATPGPWKTIPGFNPHDVDILGDPHRDKHGETHTWFATVKGNDTSKTITKANADYFAAVSPDVVLALIAVVQALPTTADGATIAPRMKLYYIHPKPPHKICEVCVGMDLAASWTCYADNSPNSAVRMVFADCHSTRELAEAARGAESRGGV